MEQALPIEELAKQRLNALVQSYSLFSRCLMEEGLDKEKVKRASDKAWSILGEQVGQQMKPLLAQAEKGIGIKQAAAMAESVHEIQANQELKQNELRTEFVKCPWQEAAESLGIPRDWRFCPSGHSAFAVNMFKAMYPDASFQLTKNMPMGDKTCEGIATF